LTHELFAGQYTRNHAERADYETLLTSCWKIMTAITCGSSFAQDKASLQPNATILSVLQGNTGRTVELRMQCGEKIGGKVEQVNDNVVLPSRLTGAEYFDGFVNVKDISAVVIRRAGK
jgi:hypothetical protein